MRCFSLLSRSAPWLALWLLVRPRAARAHGEAPVTPETVWSAWNTEPFLLLGLILAAGGYAFGVYRLWRRAGVGQGVQRWQAAAFGGGLLALVVSLVSPLEAMAGALFSAHMVQHLILVLCAAPLLVLGIPLYVWLWAFPPDWRKAFGRWWQRAGGLRAAGHALSHPISAWFIYAAVMWVWHAPPFFEAALHNELIHKVEHFSFLGGAMLYCWVLINPMGRRLTRGTGILYLFTTSVHGSLLGVLITFAPTPWYEHYVDATETWILTPLQDQQLAGLIMWIPVGMIYAGLAALLFVLWMRDVKTGMRTSERPSGLSTRSLAYPQEVDER